MAENSRTHVSDLRGAGAAALDATRGLIDLVDTVQHTIPHGPGILGLPTGPAWGNTGLVSRSLRALSGLLGGGIDVALEELARVISEARTRQEVEAVLAALNGVLGDFLATTGNPLAIQMRLRRGGRALALEPRALRWALPKANRKMVVLVHGSSMSDLQWSRRGHDHGAALERDRGFVAVYLHYNTGLSVPANGRALAAWLEALIEQWPAILEELAIVAHGMGGLVARSACHAAAAADHRWPAWLGRMVFLGAPHHGARPGGFIDSALGAGAYRAPFARLSGIRSAGMADLRRGNLLEEDGDRDVRLLPLPAGVACFAMAAVRAGDAAARGDGLVRLDSALGRHADPERALAIPESRTWVGTGMSHLDLLWRPEAYEVLSGWLA